MTSCDVPENVIGHDTEESAIVHDTLENTTTCVDGEATCDDGLEKATVCVDTEIPYDQQENVSRYHALESAAAHGTPKTMLVSHQQASGLVRDDLNLEILT